MKASSTISIMASVCSDVSKSSALSTDSTGAVGHFLSCARALLAWGSGALPLVRTRVAAASEASVTELAEVIALLQVNGF